MEPLLPEQKQIQRALDVQRAMPPEVAAFNQRVIGAGNTRETWRPAA